MKKLIVLLLMLSLFICACTSLNHQSLSTAKTDDESMTAKFTAEYKKKLDDLNYVCEKLKSNHGSLYRSVSKKNFDEIKNNLAYDIPNLSDTDFKYEVSHLLSLLDDNNASCTIVPDDEDGQYILPFKIEKYSDGFYVTSSYDKQYLGCRIDEINDMSIDKIAEKMRYIISAENDSAFYSKVCEYVHNAGLLRYMKIIDDQEKIKFTMVKDNKKTTVVLKTTKTEDASILEEVYVAKARKNSPTVCSTKYFSAKMISDDVYYLQCNICLEDSYNNINHFLQKIRSDYSAKKFKKIIVDFRYNVGAESDTVGSSTVFIPVIQEIQSMSKRGVKVYTLIGRNTIGICIANILQLKKYTNCTIVGQPTGCSVNPFVSTGFNMTMPNSRTEFTFSNKFLENDRNDKRDSIKPDITIDDTFQNRLNGSDPELQWIMNH